MPGRHDHGAEAPGLPAPVDLSRYAALAGCELHELAGGGFRLTRWNLTRHLRSVDEVAQMLAQMGARE